MKRRRNASHRIPFYVLWIPVKTLFYHKYIPKNGFKRGKHEKWGRRDSSVQNGKHISRKRYNNKFRHGNANGQQLADMRRKAQQ